MPNDYYYDPRFDDPMMGGPMMDQAIYGAEQFGPMDPEYFVALMDELAWQYGIDPHANWNPANTNLKNALEFEMEQMAPPSDSVIQNYARMVPHVADPEMWSNDAFLALDPELQQLAAMIEDRSEGDLKRAVLELGEKEVQDFIAQEVIPQMVTGYDEAAMEGTLPMVNPLWSEGKRIREQEAILEDLVPEMMENYLATAAPTGARQLGTVDQVSQYYGGRPPMGGDLPFAAGGASLEGPGFGTPLDPEEAWGDAQDELERSLGIIMEQDPELYEEIVAFAEEAPDGVIDPRIPEHSMKLLEWRVQFDHRKELQKPKAGERSTAKDDGWLTRGFAPEVGRAAEEAGSGWDPQLGLAPQVVEGIGNFISDNTQGLQRFLGIGGDDGPGFEGVAKEAQRMMAEQAPENTLIRRLVEGAMPQPQPGDMGWWADDPDRVRPEGPRPSQAAQSAMDRRQGRAEDAKKDTKRERGISALNEMVAAALARVQEAQAVPQRGSMAWWADEPSHSHYRRHQPPQAPPAVPIQGPRRPSPGAPVRGPGGQMYVRR